MRNSFPARSDASSVKGLCLRWMVRKVLRHASSDGKNERISAKTTDETSSVAVSAADCRHSNQPSPFGSPLKIVSKTDVSTATALTPAFPSDAPEAVQPARANHPTIHLRCVRPVPFSDNQGQRTVSSG